MKNQKTPLSEIIFDSHIAPLTSSETSEVKGGRESYGSSLERIHRFFQKIIYGH